MSLRTGHAVHLPFLERAELSVPLSSIKKKERLAMFTKVIKRDMPAMSGLLKWVNHSIANYLTISIILLAFLTLSACSAFLYKILLDHQNQSGLKLLREEMVTVNTILQAPNGLELLAGEIKAQQFESENQKVYVRLMDRNGRIIIESPGMAKALPRSVFPLPDGSRDILKM